MLNSAFTVLLHASDYKTSSRLLGTFNPPFGNASKLDVSSTTRSFFPSILKGLLSGCYRSASAELTPYFAFSIFYKI